jgi:hypothetical protein
MAQRGFRDIYQSLNSHGWYWGAGFSGDSVDSMHFGLADETVRSMDKAPLSSNLLTAAADYIHAMGYDTVTQEG